MASYEEAQARLFKKFDGMQPGAKLIIEKECNGRPDLWIAIAKLYIDAGNYDYEFNKDYKYFRRLTAKF